MSRTILVSAFFSLSLVLTGLVGEANAQEEEEMMQPRVHSPRGLAAKKPGIRKIDFKLSPQAKIQVRAFLASNRRAKRVATLLLVSLKKIEITQAAILKSPGNKALQKRLSKQRRAATRLAFHMGKYTMTENTTEQGPNSGGGGGDDGGGGGEQGPNSGAQTMGALVRNLQLGLGALGSQPARTRSKIAVGVRSRRILSISARRSDLAGLLEPVTSR